MLYSDHLQTAQVTAAVAQGIDDAYETAQSLILVDSPAERATLVHRLFASEIPEVEASLQQLEQLHADDPAAEKEHLQTLSDGWAQFRTLWTSDSLLAPTPDPTEVDQRLRAVFDQIEPVTDELQQVEQRDAQAAHQRGDAAARTSMYLIGVVTAVALVAGIVLILIVTRRLLPRSIAPEEEQAAFVDAMQLAGNDKEAQTLLTRRLVQAAPARRWSSSTMTRSPTGSTWPPNSTPTRPSTPGWPTRPPARARRSGPRARTGPHPSTTSSSPARCAARYRAPRCARH